VYMGFKLTVLTTNILAFNVLQFDFLLLLHVLVVQDHHQAVICGRVITFVESGFIAPYYKVFTYTL
jgi:hypothetical protein